MNEMDWRNAFINKAMQYLGTREGSDKHKEIIDAYNAYSGKPRGYTVTYKDSWCAAFVSAIACLSEVESIVPLECSCYYMIENAKSMGIWEKAKFVEIGGKISAIDKVKIGDIIFYDWDYNGTPDHVGIITNVNTLQLTVIEGNKNNAVEMREVKTNNGMIFGIAKPEFSSLVIKPYDYENIGWNHDEKGWWYSYGHNKGEYHVNNAVRIENDLYFFDTEGYCVHPESIETTEKGAMKYIHGRRVQ